MTFSLTFYMNIMKTFISISLIVSSFIHPFSVTKGD